MREWRSQEETFGRSAKVPNRFGKDASCTVEKIKRTPPRRGINTLYTT